MGFPFPIFIKASRSKISVSKEIREVNRLRLQFERSMTARLMAVFKRVGKRAADEYTQSESVSDALRPLEGELEQVFRAHYRAVIEKFGDRVYENRKQERFAQLLFSYYSMEGAQKVRGVTVQTANLIRRAIRAGEVEGEGVAKIAKRIREKTDGAIGRARSSTIARTETHAAASYATHEATKELGLPAQRKRWVSVSDGRTRSHHAAANGQEVGMDEPFIIRFNGQEIKMMYPHDGSGGPANNINCRCLALYFSDEDALFDNFVDDPVVPVVPVATYKPEIDIRKRVVSQGIGADDINDALNRHLSPLTARVADKLPKPLRIVAKRNAGVYYGSREVIESGAQRQIMTHEYGHHVDRMIAKDLSVGYFWSDIGLKSAWAADRKLMKVSGVSRANQNERLSELRDQLFETETIRKELSNGKIYEYVKVGKFKFEGADGISDIIDSFVKGKFRKNYNAFGHSASYWSDPTSATSEAFANLFAISNSPEAVKWVEANIPNLWAAFKEILEDIDANR
jgi:hypothetical protein